MKTNLWLVALLIGMAGCGERADAVRKGSVEAAIRVKIEPVKAITASPNLSYSGTVEAFQTIPLNFRGSGTVEQVLVQEGDAVRKGQLLATIDRSDNQNLYNVSLASYQQAKDAYDRMKQVYQKGSLSEVKWVEMETKMEQAKSQLELAKNNLDKCNLYAPVSGFVGSRNVEPGQSSVSSFSPIELVKIEKVYVKISVPENEIGKIKKGNSAGFVVPALGSLHFEGVISHVGVVADRFSRTYEVKILVDNPDLAMKPGMVCDVELDGDDRRELVVVPYNAVSKEPGGSYVFLVSPDQNSVQKQLVEVGNFQPEGLVILKGLTSSQSIVVEGKEKLSDHSLIRL